MQLNTVVKILIVALQPGLDSGKSGLHLSLALQSQAFNQAAPSQACHLRF